MMADKYDAFLDSAEDDAGAPASVDKYDAFLDSQDSPAVSPRAASTPQSRSIVPAASRPTLPTEGPSRETMRKVQQTANPVGWAETALQMGTGALSSAAGGIAGLAGTVIPGEQGQGAKWSQAIQQAGTYQPRTESGKTISGAIGAIGSAVDDTSKALFGSAGKLVGAENEGELVGAVAPSIVGTLFGIKTPLKSIATSKYTGVGKLSDILPKPATPVTPPVKSSSTASALESTGQAIKQAASDTDWQRAAGIEAAKVARENKIVLNPSSVSESPRTIRMAAAGGSAHFNTAASIANKSKWNDMVRADLGLDKNAQLTAGTYDSVRKIIGKPYDDAANLGKLTPNADVLAAIREIDIPEILPAGEVAAGKMARTTDYVTGQIENGMTGKMALDTTKTLRREAKQVFDSIRSGNRVSPVEIDAAKGKMRMAEKLDELISSNISDPKWKASFDDSRRKMALTYAYERATNLARRQVDPQVFAQEMEGRHFLTGNAKKMGEIAANYPEIANVYAEHGTTFGMPVRSGVIGTTGFAVGSLYGSPVATSALAASVGALGEKMYGKRLRSEAGQAKFATPVDRRIPEHNTGMMQP